MLASIFHSEVIKWNENNNTESSEKKYDLSVDHNSRIIKIPDLSDDIFREENEKDQIIDCF